MTRDEVLHVVKKYIAENIEGADVAALDATRSMKDYGINSLDMVDVVSRSMRDLKVKVPRTDLNKISTIDGLVDVLHKAVEARVG